MLLDLKRASFNKLREGTGWILWILIVKGKPFKRIEKSEKMR